MSTKIMETYHALIQAVSAERSPYQEGLLTSLAELERGLQMRISPNKLGGNPHVNSVCQPADDDGPQVWPGAGRIMSGAFHPVGGASDEDEAAN